MKVLYFHIPKTAGSSINKFFENHIEKCHFHIEGIKDLNKEFCEKFDFISGHVSFNGMDNMLDLKEWFTLTTLREPKSYVISHIKWVRKLADPGEEQRFNAHPKPFQKIALKMKETDFSDSIQVSLFVKWLESENLLFLHNTQTYFMNAINNRNTFTDKQIQDALNHLDKIDFVCIQENIDDFINIIGQKFDWKPSKTPKENINTNNYGLDINNSEVMNALLPLYDIDSILYKHALDKFIKYEQS